MEEITILLEDLARDAQTTKRRAAVLARLEALAGDVEALAAGERARKARALVVVILARAAPRLRGCDVVEAVDDEGVGPEPADEAQGQRARPALEAVGAPAVAQRPPLLARRLVVQLHLRLH